MSPRPARTLIVPSQLRVHQDIQDALGRLIVVPVRFDRFSSGFGQFVDGDDDVLPGSNLHTSSSLRCGLPNTSSRGGARRRPLRRRRQRRREERRFRGGGGSKTHLLFSSSSSVCARALFGVSCFCAYRSHSFDWKYPKKKRSSYSCAHDSSTSLFQLVQGPFLGLLFRV